MRKIFKGFTIILDVALLILIIVGFCLDLFLFKNLYGCGYPTHLKETNLVVTGLLPLTITVISIVISFSKNDVYGIPMNRFHKISEFRFYNLRHIFVVSCCLFIVSLLFYIHDLRFANLICEAVTIVFSIVIGVQQLSVFINDRTAVEKLIKSKYKIEMHKLPDEEKYKNDVFYLLLRNFLLTEGISNVYEIFSEKLSNKKSMESGDPLYNLVLAFDLLSYKKRYFSRICDLNEKKMITLNHDKLAEEVKNYIGDLKIIVYLWEFSDLFKDNHFRNYEEHLSLLHKLAITFNFSDIEQNLYKDIFRRISFGFYVGDDKFRSSACFVKFAVKYVAQDDEWFIRYYRNSVRGKLFDEMFNSTFSTFISFIIFYIFDNYNGDDKTTNINKFMNTRYNIEESNFYLDSALESSTWNETFFNYIENCSSNEIVELLINLLRIFDSLNSLDETLYGSKFLKNLDSNKKLFTRKTIMFYWFICVAINKNFNESVFNDMSKYGFTKTDWEDLVDTVNKMPRKLDDSIYLYRLFESIDFNVDRFKDIKKDVSEEKTTKPKAKPKEENFYSTKMHEKIKKGIIELFNEKVKFNTFYDATIDNYPEQILLTYHMEDKNISKILDEFKNNKINEFLNTITNMSLATIKDKNLTQIFKKPSPKAKNFISYNTGNFVFICEKNAVKFNAIIKESSFNVEKESEDYIKKFVLNKFDKTDSGLYRFIDDENYYFLNEADLIKKLKNKLFKITFEVDYNFEYDNSRGFAVYNNDD